MLRTVIRRSLAASALVLGTWTAGAAAQVSLSTSTFGGLDPGNAFEETLIDLCFVNPPNFADLSPEQIANFLNLCGNAFPGGPLGAGGSSQITTTTNLGNVGAQGRLDYGQGSSGYRKIIEDRTDPEKRAQAQAQTGRAASGAFSMGNFGIFGSLASADADRDITVLENGYDEDSSTFLAGVDYSFSVGERQMPVVVGLTGGRTSTDTRFSLNGGSEDSGTWTGIAFASIVPMDNMSITGYLGRSNTDFDSSRTIVFGNVTGTATSSFDGDQTMAGIGATYDYYVGNWSIGGFGNLDWAVGDIDPHSEAGTTGLEVSYAKQSNRLLTLSAGLRGGYTWFQGWGSLTPYAEGAWVHEFDDDARTITTSLVIDPTRITQYSTDNPDRDYGRIGAGLIIEIQHGPQLFFGYERRISHSYLDVTSFSGGARFQF